MWRRTMATRWGVAWLVLLVAAAAASPSAVAQSAAPGSVDSDRAALVALYNATDGPNWTRSQNWLSSAPLHLWKGVSTSRSGRVTTLSLEWNNLSGPLPPELGNLSQLQRLYLYSNDLVGPIPPELGNLTDLEDLSLSHNSLTGPIPPELGNLTNLKHLALNGNMLSGEIPAQLGNLTHLRSFGVSLDSLSACLPDTARHLLTPLLAHRYGDGPLHWPSCGSKVRFVAEDGKPLIYDDRIFVYTSDDLYDLFESDWSEHSNVFYEHFEDAFDFLVLAYSSRHSADGSSYQPPYAAAFSLVSNDVKGIGLDIFSDAHRFGSAGRLQGIVHAGNMDTPALLHELMHRWANFVVTIDHPDHGVHWGFSSANGILGGFDIANLVEHGSGRYSLGGDYLGGNCPVGGDCDDVGYSPLELYLAGFIPPEEVPDLWVAEDGQWLWEADGLAWDDVIADPDSDYCPDDLAVVINGQRTTVCYFVADKVRTLTIEDIVAEHGARVPHSSRSQRQFRAAVMVSTSEDDPIPQWKLDELSSFIADFGSVGGTFHKATGGRATITLDGLSQFLKQR